MPIKSSNLLHNIIYEYILNNSGLAEYLQLFGNLIIKEYLKYG